MIVQPEFFQKASIQSSDVVDFVERTRDLPAAETVNVLNRMHTVIDGLIENSEVLRIESFLDDLLVIDSNLCHFLTIFSGNYSQKKRFFDLHF